MGRTLLTGGTEKPGCGRQKPRTQNMYGLRAEYAILVAENPGYAILLAEKAPAGMGTPRPGFAKLRFGLGLARARIA